MDSPYCWYASNSGGNHHDVGGKTANAFALFDMSGNVWEWCSDFYAAGYTAGAATDPTGPETGSDCILRGGCLDNGSDIMWSAIRGSNDQSFRNFSFGFRLVRSGTYASMSTLAGGEFTMGQTGVAEPTHTVTVSPFYAGRYEIMNTEYCAFLNDEGNLSEGSVTWWDTVDSSTYNGIQDAGSGSPRYTVRSGFASRPVVYVSWYGAVAYCNWASAKDGLTPCYGAKDSRGLPSEWRTKNGYRLATEAEWEYACRGGTTTAYYWGDTIGGAYCWYASNSGSNHHVVGGKTANAFGLFDMSGNVWEWCSDWYAAYTADAATDPTGPETGGTHVIHGGAFGDVSGILLSAHRYGHVPSVRGCNIGFRIVRAK